jgi:hypothetical protein
MTMTELVKRAWKPLESRKVRVALATVIAAFAANWGFHVDEELVLTILGVGASLILGIAHEDAGRKTEPRP